MYLSMETLDPVRQHWSVNCDRNTIYAEWDNYLEDIVNFQRGTRDKSDTTDIFFKDCITVSYGTFLSMETTDLVRQRWSFVDCDRKTIHTEWDKYMKDLVNIQLGTRNEIDTTNIFFKDCIAKRSTVRDTR
jgi:hypothetical protein